MHNELALFKASPVSSRYPMTVTNRPLLIAYVPRLLSFASKFATLTAEIGELIPLKNAQIEQVTESCKISFSISRRTTPPSANVTPSLSPKLPKPVEKIHRPAPTMRELWVIPRSKD
jgi:hypothetical protein